MRKPKAKRWGNALYTTGLVRVVVNHYVPTRLWLRERYDAIPQTPTKKAEILLG
jgi:hypothetical protein